jgi:3-methyladenine DNA glycosylase AlkD
MELWEKDQREYQYVAIDWLNTWKKEWIHQEDIKHLKWLIENKTWWDSVDAIASNYLGKFSKKFPEMVNEFVEDWRNESNFWINRSCLIFQLKYKKEVDFELLKSLIVQFQPNKEFFIQKAIGWSLRQYSKFAPDEVRDFVKEIKLSGLAYREATKYI